VDRLRQLNTRMGIRPMRVFLVWERWSGSEGGEGTPTVIARMEILPTPKVESLDSISLRMMAAGVLPAGSIHVSEISVNYTEDQLLGFAIPSQAWVATENPPKTDSSTRIPAHSGHGKDRTDFYYEVAEDGRGDDPPARNKYRIADQPFRKAGDVQWIVTLERVSEDNDRRGRNQLGPDKDDF
jgi:hypothetical protein